MMGAINAVIAQPIYHRRLQSYTVVAEKRKDEGPRPGAQRRAAQIAASLR